MSFLRDLFNTEGFPPRWHCGDWSSGHGWLHIISDTLIFGAYLAIPVSLGYFALQKRNEIPFTRIVWLFVAFILSCGATHLVDATLFWKPWYRFSGSMKLVTAVVSWVTVFSMIRIAPKALRLPGLEKMNRELEAQISANERTSRKLEAKNEELSRFAAVVSHDLKSPLSSAVLFSALAREANEKGDLEGSGKLLKQLDEILMRSARLVEDVHNYASSENVSLPQAEISLGIVMEEVCQTLAQSIQESGAKFEIEPNLPEVFGNEGALVRIFSNLVQNAIKYRSEDRPIVIQISLDSEGSDDSKVVISVRDNGSGIEEENLGRIFDPFVRACDSEKTAGSGLGLSVCTRLLGRMGGTICVESNVGEGTEFKIRLNRPSA